jgi:hypothetical protein
LKGEILDWKTFIVELVKALAWPVVITVLIFQLKDKITELLPRLRKVKHKDTELEFAEGVSKLVKEKEKKGNAELEDIVSNETIEKHQFLLKLAEISPRSAVLEAFREVEHSSAKVAAKLHPEKSSAHGGGPPMRLQQILSEATLGKNEIKMFNQLRMLRNKAAHDKEFNLQGMPIEAYVELSLGLANSIDLIGKDL